MIEYTSQILELIIGAATLIGVGFLVYFFIKLRYVNAKIESVHRSFEEKRDSKRNQKIPIEYINSQIDQLEKEKAEIIAPLERERQIIISTIPFIK